MVKVSEDILLKAYKKYVKHNDDKVCVYFCYESFIERQQYTYIQTHIQTILKEERKNKLNKLIK